MHVCYNPETLAVLHTITSGFADIHVEHNPNWLRVERFVSLDKLRLQRTQDGAVVALDGDEPVRTMAVTSAADNFPRPPRTLPEVRERALKRLAARREEAAPRPASAYYQRKEAWARAHLNGDVAHPVINAEAVEKGIACHELCGRIVARAEQARAGSAAVGEQAEGAYARAERIVKACLSIEEIDDYMAHFG